MKNEPQQRIELTSPFAKLLGIECVNASDGNAEVTLYPQESHKNIWHVVHGGVLLTMLDVGMSMAARSNMSDEQGVLTINLASNFVDVAAGECIKVCASTIKMTATMAFVEAKLYSDSRLCATGSATFKIFKHRVIS
jgi:uncharacterized protein (TIGR00369 family)